MKTKLIQSRDELDKEVKKLTNELKRSENSHDWLKVKNGDLERKLDNEKKKVAVLRANQAKDQQTIATLTAENNTLKNQLMLIRQQGTDPHVLSMAIPQHSDEEQK